ncbi:hypothetical protein [Chlamydia sp. 17-3921]|uniref:hypothetical protein n=1 Tax=Chlamydia sp. 17-3921 TaxID=2675798 RepID=UPI001919E090|nr:hypothetical protein [Chlamydia sp. 17-3921]
MFKLLFQLITFAGHVLSTPIFILQDALGIDPKSCETSPPKAISCQTQYLQVNNANFKHLKEQTLGYRQYDATILCTLPITMQSGLLMSTGYVGANILWNSLSTFPIEDPKTLGFTTFQDKSYYNYILLSVGAYTLSMKNWQWSVMFSGLLDPENFKVGYGLYQGILSGKYQATDKLSAVFGVINETGLHQEKAWPLIGVTYKFNENLTLNSIYPTNFSLEYHCTPVCDLGVSYRLTRFRKKLPKNNFSSSLGIFEYQGRAIEANVKLTPWPGSFIRGFYGWSLGSDISLADDHNNNKNTYPFKTSAFFGGSAKIAF